MASSKLSLVRNTGDDGSDRPLDVSHSTTSGGLNKVKGQTVTWGALKARLMKEVRADVVTQKKFDAMTHDQKQREKMRAGFLFGGSCANGHRTNANVQSRSLINLDIDNMSKADFLAFKFECGDPDANDLNQFEYVWYTTRSHTPEKPKFRIILPFTASCAPDKFIPVSRIIASKFDPTMETFDRVSFVLGQMMYWPMTNKDGVFEAGHNKGPFIDVDAELEAFGDWQDFSKLPSKEEEDLSSHNKTGNKIASPFEKEGIVGAFCRAFSIEDAIDEFIPDVYEKSISTEKGKDRYTYLKSETGQTSGVLVYPDQGLMFSHHNSDPCGDGHGHNAFDMVRLHLYGDLDEGSKIDSPTRQKSFKALEEKVSELSPVKQQLLQENYDFEAMVDSMFGGKRESKKVKDDLDNDVDASDPEPGKAESEVEEDELGPVSAAEKLRRWMETLQSNSNGVFEQTISNVFKILVNDQRVKGIIAHNEFRGMPVKMRAFADGALGSVDGKPIRDVPVMDDTNGELWSDLDDSNIKLFLSQPRGKGEAWYGIQASDSVMTDALRLASHYQRFHPVKLFFESVKWDGKKRLDRMFVDYFGCPDNEYYRMTARLSMIAAVDRIYVPGAKWDHVPILEGAQGKQKSTFIKALANDWFAELRAHDLEDSRKMAELFEGVLIVEIPELHSFSKAEATALKSFFSSGADKARAAFARRVSENKRQVTFWGSTNEPVYLKDPTGNRRYWPIVIFVDKIDVAKLRRERLQLWAEAKHYRDEMRAEQPFGDLPLYLEDGSEAALIAKQLQEQKSIETSDMQNAGTLEVWLDELDREDRCNCNKPIDDADFGGDFLSVRRDRICIKEIVRFCPEYEGKSYGRQRQLEIGAAMARIPGWKPSGKVVKTPGYGPQRLYYRVGGHYDPENDDL